MSPDDSPRSPPEALRAYQIYDETLEKLLEVTDIETVTRALRALLQRLVTNREPMDPKEAAARARLSARGVPNYAQIKSVVEAEMKRGQPDPNGQAPRKDLFA